MNCSEVEILLADYVEETLHGETKSTVEAHLAECAACAELASDAAAAVGFMERAADVEAPPELVARLLAEITTGPSRLVVRPSWTRRLWNAIFGGRVSRWLGKTLEPRYAMSMAMTALSFAMVFRVAGIDPRQWSAAHLNPAKAWSLTENRVTRVWDRGVKYYESRGVVFEIQAQLREWNDDPAADNFGPPASDEVNSR